MGSCAITLNVVLMSRMFVWPTALWQRALSRKRLKHWDRPSVLAQLASGGFTRVRPLLPLDHIQITVAEFTLLPIRKIFLYLLNVASPFPT
jgi:hypothetical protein